MTHTTHCCPTHDRTFDFVKVTETILIRLRKMYFVSQQRRALSLLDQRSLNDMGISFEQAAKESARPFWDIA